MAGKTLGGMFAYTPTGTRPAPVATGQTLGGISAPVKGGKGGGIRIAGTDEVPAEFVF